VVIAGENVLDSIAIPVIPILGFSFVFLQENKIVMVIIVKSL
jgi:hypothetical protein